MNKIYFVMMKDRKQHKFCTFGKQKLSNHDSDRSGNNQSYQIDTGGLRTCLARSIQRYPFRLTDSLYEGVEVQRGKPARTDGGEK